MRFHVRRLIAFLPAAFLAACAAFPAHEALPAGTHDKIASTEVIVPIRQSEIYVFVPPSSAGAAGGAAFGLLGALVGAAVDAGINSARTSKAETAVKPLRDALVDYNFDAALQGELKGSLSQVSWLGAGDIHAVRETTPEALDLALTNSKAGAVLFVTTEYHLDNDGNHVFITVQASLFPHNDALRSLKSNRGKIQTAITNSIYHNTLTFEAKTPSGTDDRDRNIGAWSASSGAEMRAVLSLGAKKLALALADDLQRTDDTLPAGATATTVDGQPASILARDDDGTLLRLKDGTLKYAAKSVF